MPAAWPTVYAAHRRRAIAYGAWRPWADAQPVRDHISRLRASGMSLAAIASVAGVALSTVKAIAAGRSTRVRASTAAALLTVRPPQSATGGDRLHRVLARHLATAGVAPPEGLDALVHAAVQVELGGTPATLDARAMAARRVVVAVVDWPLAPGERVALTRALVDGLGLTPATAARALGISARTAQRDLAAA